MRDIPTGPQDLESFTGGLQGRGLVIIATPSSGIKLSLALSMALHVATTTSHGVGLFSLETNKRYLVQQLLAMRTGIDVYRLQDGWITDEERMLVMATANTLSGAHLWIDDTADLSVEQLRERARQLVERHKIALVMVDNLHLIRSSVHGKQFEDRLQELGEIHHSLKVLADELNIPVVVFVPIARDLASRLSKRHRPSKPSKDSQEKVFDHALFLYHDELSATKTESKHIVIGRMMMTKHHNGLVTELDLSIQWRQARFRVLEQGERKDPEAR